MVTSSVLMYGEEDEHYTFDMDGPLQIRECSDDKNYPYEIYGTTKGGHAFFLDLSKEDCITLLAEIDQSQLR